MKTISTTITNKAKQVFTTLLAVIVCSFALYSFAIASTTVSISDAKIMNGKIQDLRTEIAGLESEYYAMINDLSVEQAQIEGFVQKDTVRFAKVNESTYVAYNN
jgi:hypothetical protein